MKNCMKCGVKKPLSDFYAHSGMSDGHLNKCKSCTKKDVAKNQARAGSVYDHSEKGVIRVIYKTQKRNQKLRSHGELPYTKNELSAWLYSNGFKEIYESWKESGFTKDLKPSVDRIDSLKGYSLDNIQLITWGENRRLQYDDIKKATGSSGKRCKPVNKLDQNGVVICQYVSYSSASRDAGYSLEYAIKNGVKCKKGFFWSYA